MSYMELFYGDQPNWMGSGRESVYSYSRPRPPTALVLHVPLCCENCVQKIRKALSKDYEVESVDVDMPKNKIIVNGYANPEMVLRKVRKIKKTATYWDSSYDYSSQSPLSHTSTLYDYNVYNTSNPHSYDDEYTSGGRSPSSYGSSYYEYSRDSPNAHYNRRHNQDSYDGYRYR